MTYNIKIEAFEGPFDLLLFFIERDELDIYDIPIAKITDDFLGYVHTMENLNIDLASEFILVAATLMRIKAKMLIPRKDVDENGQEIDPREELIQRLLEYKSYKEITEDLRRKEESRSMSFPRGNVEIELQSLAEEALADAELESLTLYRLLQAFKRVMERFEYQKLHPVHTIIQYTFTVQEEQASITFKLQLKPRLEFMDVFLGCENRIHAIITFLALLEMINSQVVRMIAGDTVNNFWIEAQPEADKSEEE
ncbi:MAG: segregation/condensation protein A [Saprospiraceae bacterium]|uniref:Segregation and condensation protein A n=1 Tax=Candidatus Opimibacter skivensis TaxID=2982028 RepID=A0A9D7XVN5_9BACT|nr:segregation/condensation protein A [Candidatus Opimibacter skivensis]